MLKKVKALTVMAIGGSVFAMHFGGSCMLWPVTWGQQSGSAVIIAYLGIFITAIFFPWLAYLAVARQGTLFNLASKSVNKPFAQMFGGLMVMVLGPLFAIPRMSAASWDAICQMLGLTHSPFIGLLLFTVTYYLIVYWFLFKRNEVIEKIAKYLLPVLLVAIIAVVAKSLHAPMSQWVPSFYPEHPFVYGFINGYQSMDLPAALVFATLIIVNLSGNYNLKGRLLNRYLVVTTGIGFLLLGTSHFTQMLVGASTGDLFIGITYARLYATIIIELWGRIGGAVFNVALLFAALTSAVGLAGGTAAYFEEASERKISYRSSSVAVLVISILVSLAGLSEIVRLTAPILEIIYPPSIVIVLLSIFKFKYREISAGAVVGAFLWGLYEGYCGYALLGGYEPLFSFMRTLIPGAEAGFGWVFIAFSGSLLGYFYAKLALHEKRS